MQPDIVFSDPDQTLNLQGDIVACTAKELRLATTVAAIRRALAHEQGKDRLVINQGGDYLGGVAVVDKLAIAPKSGTFTVDDLQPKDGKIVQFSVAELDLVQQIQQLRTAVANLNKAQGVNASGDTTAAAALAKLQEEVAGMSKKVADLESKLGDLAFAVSLLQGYVGFVAHFTGAAKAWSVFKRTLEKPTVPKKEIPPNFPPVWPP